jgi:hypothetical protein
MRNVDSCRRWRCMLCPCNVRHTFFIHFWNRTILLCMPCICLVILVTFPPLVYLAIRRPNDICSHTHTHQFSAKYKRVVGTQLFLTLQGKKHWWFLSLTLHLKTVGGKRRSQKSSWCDRHRALIDVCQIYQSFFRVLTKGHASWRRSLVQLREYSCYLKRQ